MVINVFFMYSPFREDPDLEIKKITYLEIDFFLKGKRFFLKAKGFVEEICILSTTLETIF